MRCEDVTAMCWFEVYRTSELPGKGNGFILFALCKKNQKAHQRFANFWTPGTIQSSAGKDLAKISGGSCRNQFCLQNAGVKALNRCERVTVVQTQDWCFYEKELLYCKLTVGYRGLNLQLLVRFGAVQIWNFSMLKKAFLYRKALHELKKRLYRETKSFPFTESFTNFTQSRFYAQKLLFARAFLRCPQKIPIFTNQIKSFWKVPRFFKPRINAPQPQLPTATIKTFQGSFEGLQTSNQRT